MANDRQNAKYAAIIETKTFPTRHIEQMAIRHLMNDRPTQGRSLRQRETHRHPRLFSSEAFAVRRPAGGGAFVVVTPSITPNRCATTDINPPGRPESV